MINDKWWIFLSVSLLDSKGVFFGLNWLQKYWPWCLVLMKTAFFVCSFAGFLTYKNYSALKHHICTSWKTLVTWDSLDIPSLQVFRFFCPSVSAAAVHACLCGSFPSGRSHLPLPPLQSGDSLHLLLGRLHHPSFHEPCDLRFSGWAFQEVLGSVPSLSKPKHHQDQTGVTES